MLKIDSILAATSKPKWLLLLFLLTLINFTIIGFLTAQIMNISGGANLLDFSFGHTANSVNSTLEAYGTEGISLYRWVQRIDLIHPLIYSLLFASLFYILFRQTRVHISIYLPLIAGILDYLENIFLFQMVNTYPQISSSVAQIANIISLAKNVILIAVIAALLVGIIAFVVKNKN